MAEALGGSRFETCVEDDCILIRLDVAVQISVLLNFVSGVFYTP